MASHAPYHYDWDRPSEANPMLLHGIKMIDLAAETRALADAHDPERTATTLARLDTLRFTLMRLKSGAKVKPHHTDHELCIHTVAGHVSIHTPLKHFELTQGCVAILERGLVHDIEAHQDSAILVTVGMWHREAERPAEWDYPPAED